MPLNGHNSRFSKRPRRCSGRIENANLSYTMLVWTFRRTETRQRPALWGCLADRPVVAVTAPTGGVSSGDGIVIGNLFGMCATDADQTEKVELSLTGVLGQWPDRRGREGLGEDHGCPRSSLPDGTAVKAAGTSDTTVRVRFDGVPVVAAGP
jgi:Uncharacterized conserved protein (DUF2190)